MNLYHFFYYGFNPHFNLHFSFQQYSSKASVHCTLRRFLGSLNKGAWPPLYGIPFAVKDNIDVAGRATTAACPAYKYIAKDSAPAVSALIAAGEHTLP